MFTLSMSACSYAPAVRAAKPTRVSTGARSTRGVLTKYALPSTLSEAVWAPKSTEPVTVCQLLSAISSCGLWSRVSPLHGLEAVPEDADLGVVGDEDAGRAFIVWRAVAESVEREGEHAGGRGLFRLDERRGGEAAGGAVGGRRVIREGEAVGAEAIRIVQAELEGEGGEVERAGVGAVERGEVGLVDGIGEAKEAAGDTAGGLDADAGGAAEGLEGGG